MMKRVIAIGLAAAYLLGVVAIVAAAPTGPLAEVIEGAKKEGTVSAKLVAGFTENSMYRLEKAVKDKYGVDLKIKFASSIYYSNDVTEAIMEEKAGAIPTWDLLTLTSHVATGMKAGVFERVDWRPLLTEGTNPNVVLDNPLTHGGIVYTTFFTGLMYNPEKIKVGEIPKTLADMANPKWKGKGGVLNSANTWVRWSFFLGKEKVLPSLGAIIKNEAIQGGYSDLYNRYMLGEILFCTLNSGYFRNAQDKGVPAAWQSLDIADIQENALVVRKGTRHPNAAKLVALYLASPEGSKLVLGEAKFGSLHYPGNYEHDIKLQNERQGVTQIFGDRKTEVLEFYGSKEAAQLQKEIQLILQTGGAR